MQKLFEGWRRHLNEEDIDEGLEQLTPENFEIVLAAFEKFIKEPAIVTALLGGGVAAAVDAVKKNFQAAPATGPTEPTRMGDEDAELSEKKKYKDSFYKAKEDRADDLMDKGVPDDVAYGVADKQMAKAGKKDKK